jgi:hypothetical protein
VTAASDTARVCPRTEHRSPGHDKERDGGKGGSCGGCRGCHSSGCCGWRQCFGLHRWRRGRRFHCRRLDGSRRWIHPRSRECRPGYRCHWKPRCGCRSAHCCRSRWNSCGYNIRAGSLSCSSIRRGRRAQGRRPGCGWSDSCCTQNSFVLRATAGGAVAAAGYTVNAAKTVTGGALHAGGSAVTFIGRQLRPNAGNASELTSKL